MTVYHISYASEETFTGDSSKCHPSQMWHYFSMEDFPERL